MDLLELLFVPEAVIGCIVGLLLAGVVHRWAPKPEPVILEAALVAAGFIGGLIVGWVTDKRDGDEQRRS
jgi:membrane protease YdiL (CAAX protease family)